MSYSVILPTLNEAGHIIKLIENGIIITNASYLIITASAKIMNET